MVYTGVVETHAVDDAALRTQPEQARLRVAGLGTGRDRADLDETEAEMGQPAQIVAVLVQSGGKTDRVGEIQAHHPAGPGYPGFRDQPAQMIEQFEGGFVGGFGVLGEGQRTDQLVQHGVSRICRNLGNRSAG